MSNETFVDDVLVGTPRWTAEGRAQAGKPENPVRLYSMKYSGHGHRVQLFLSLLDIPYDKVDIDPESEDLRQPDFLELNPWAQVPVIVDGNVTLFDSNAILVYLAKRYGGPHWLPGDPVGSALVQQWFSVAAGQIAFGPCAARRLLVYKEELVPLEVALQISDKLLRTLDGILATRVFAAGDHPTVADISAYTYIAHATEGGISLEPFANIRSWLRKIESLPGFVPMPWAAHVQC